MIERVSDYTDDFEIIVELDMAAEGARARKELPDECLIYHGDPRGAGDIIESNRPARH